MRRNSKRSISRKVTFHLLIFPRHGRPKTTGLSVTTPPDNGRVLGQVLRIDPLEGSEFPRYGFLQSCHAICYYALIHETARRPSLCFIFTNSSLYLCYCTLLGVYFVVEDRRQRHALHKANPNLPPDAFHQHYPGVRGVETLDRTPTIPLPISFLLTASLSPRVPGFRFLRLSTPNTRRALSLHMMHSRSRSVRWWLV